MTSVIGKVAGLELDPARQLAEDQLREAQDALDGKSSGKFSSKGAARLAKLSALADLDSFDMIAEFADPKESNDELSFYAYALYRLGEIEKLREVVSHHQDSSLCSRLALAQAEYKAGNLDAALGLLEACASSILPEDEGDRKVNMAAIQALQGTVDAKDNSPSASFDEAFNRASSLLTRGLSEKALETLQEANSLAEEEDDRQAAIAQAAYAHLISGRKDEASKLLETLSTSSLSLALRLVVQNNRLSLSYEGGDVTAAHKALLEFDDFSRINSKRELNALQRQIIQRNQLKLLAYVGIGSSIRKARQHQNEFPSDLEPLCVALHASSSTRALRRMANEGNIASKLCLAALENKGWEYPIATTGQLKNGHLGHLIPAVNKVLQGNQDSANAFVNSLGNTELRNAGTELLQPNEAVPPALLSSIEQMVESFNLEKLETTLPASLSIGSSSLKSGLSRKRTGKRKLPESFDPAKEPNPERWLAKQDRSDYKPKKKKTSQATQGSAAVVEEKPTTVASQVVGAKSKKKNKKKGKK